jgi:O-antigen/teichoic acid export membrane protein
MSFLKGLSIVMGANLILLVLSFLNNKLLYICLDKENNGLFFLIVRFSIFISFFSGDWLRLSNMNIAGQAKDLSKTLVANTIWYCALVGIVLIPLIAVFNPFLRGLFPGVPLLLILSAVGVAIILMIRDSSQVLLLVSKRTMSYGLTHIVGGSVFFFLDLLFLTVFHMGLHSVLIAWAISGVVGMFWALFSHMSVHGYSIKPSWNVFKKSRKLGVRSWLAIVGMFLMINIHVFVIGPIIGDPVKTLTILAVFSVCFRVFQVLQRFSDVTSGFLLSNVVQEDRDSGSRMTVLTVRNVTFFSLTISIFAVLMGKGLINFISSSEYISAYIPLLIMLPGMIAINSGSVLNSFYWAHGYPLRIILAPFAVSALALILDFLLIDSMGVSGIALSFSLVSLGWVLYTSLNFKKMTGIGLIQLFVPRYSDIIYVADRLRKFYQRKPA